MPQWPRAEDGIDTWQLYVGLAIVIVSWLDVRPIGGSTRGWWIVVFLVLNSLLVLVRSAPDTLIGQRGRVLLLFAALVAAGVIFALAPNSFATVFAFFVSGNAGYRLAPRHAFAFAVLTSAVSIAAIVVAHHAGLHPPPWWLGAFTGLPVFIGQSNRGYHLAIVEANRALAEAERATQAEARAHALAERGRIARDVHDVLAHTLAGINLQLEVAGALMDDGQVDQARVATATAQGLVREGISEVSRTVSALREDTLPLPETLRRMVSSGAMQGTVSITGTPRTLPAEVSQGLVRVAQEALTNATRHAPGAAVEVHLDCRADAVLLVVTNDPPSDATPTASPGSGMGLVGMRERIELLGGQLRVGPTPDGGWSVEAEVPA